jgi:hypothetical protein
MVPAVVISVAVVDFLVAAVGFIITIRVATVSVLVAVVDDVLVATVSVLVAVVDDVLVATVNVLVVAVRSCCSCQFISY